MSAHMSVRAEDLLFSDTAQRTAFPDLFQSPGLHFHLYKIYVYSASAEVIIKYKESDLNRSFCVVYGAALADEMDLDLTGILELRFDLFDDIAGDDYHLLVAHDLGLDGDADLSARLDSVSLFDAGEAVGDLL